MRSMPFLTLVALLDAAIGASCALARPVNYLTYDEMASQADMAVIATPVARKELPGEFHIPGIRRGNEPIPAVAVETTFRSVVLLKGTISGGEQTFVLFHYRELDPRDDCVNCAQLVDFDPTATNRKQYIMFLKRAPDNRYEAVNGQTDPGISIEKLAHTLHFPPQ